MKAMIFAAGLGTRLMPLTLTRPKALVEVNGKALLQVQVERMIRLGIREVIVNVHHHAEQVLDFLKAHDDFGIRIEVSDESDRLLDTGGGLKKAAWFFDDGNPFLLHNVDLVHSIDLEDMISYHRAHRALATLAVKTRKSSRYLLFDGKMQLGGWEHVTRGDKIIVDPDSTLRRYAFSGVHVIDPALLSMITESGKFSIIDTYLRLAGSQIIRGYLHESSDWVDVGKIDDLERLSG